MNGLPYYRRFPRDFLDATIGWPLDLKGAYGVLLDLIYMNGGGLPDDPRYISGHLGCSVRAWNGHRAELMARGKIKVTDGIISNFRASLEMDNLQNISERQRKNASQPRKNNGLTIATAKPRLSHTDTDTEEDTEANASGGQAAEDFAKQVFDRAVAFLGRNGTKESTARAFVGKLRKDHPDTAIFDAFTACSKAGAVDPIPWITARLGKPKASQDMLNQVFADLLKGPPQ